MKRIAFYICVALLGLNCISCNHESSDISEENVKVATVQFSLNTNTRTVLPQAVDASDLSNLTVQAQKNGYTRLEKSFTTLDDFLSANISLDVGIWTFTLTAKKGGTTYSASTTTEIVYGDNKINFDLSISDMGNGKGSFSLTLDFSEANNADKVTSAKCSIQTMYGSAVSGFSQTSVSVENESVTYSLNSLPVGNYRVFITLYSNDLELITWREIVVISSDLQSTATQKLESLDELYTITYHLNDDEERIANLINPLLETYTIKSDNYTIPIPVRQSYEFLGWYELPDFSGEPVTIINTSRRENINLYAKWLNIIGDSSLKTLNFIGNNVHIYESKEKKLEIISNTNISEYYIEYSSLFIEATAANPYSTITLSNGNLELEINADDSTEQVVTLSVISEDDQSINKYLIHAVKIYTYDEACELIASRKKDIFVKIIDDANNIDTVGSGTYTPYTPCKIGRAINSNNNFKVMIDLSSNELNELKAYAFVNCEMLVSINLPITLSAVGNCAFSNCKNMVELELSDNIRYIGKGALSGCSNLKEFIIPDGVSIINSNLFWSCFSLEKITVPYTVNYIDEGAFSDCNNLIQIVFLDSESEWYGSVVSNFGIKYSVGSMDSPESNVRKLGNYKYYRKGN